VAASRADFFAQCDVLSIQLRLTPETQSFIKPADLALMKRDAILINTSRAELIEPQALFNALQLGAPGYAAVDVYEVEPIVGFRDPLQSLPNCLCSPHLGFVEQVNYEQYFGAAFAGINTFSAP
jgi:D-3-phosphoglycerate dehydrogenase / 2-oxoglutarate reductase